MKSSTRLFPGQQPGMGGRIVDCELYPTTVTPFDENDRIDFESAMALIELFHQNSCDGIFAVCQSSEMFFLTREEKLALASFFIRECRKRRMKCVVSGHTEDTLEEQMAYLLPLEELEPDAIVLVTNRLAAEGETDEALIERLEYIVRHLKPQTRLGIYECPYPYKRLLSPAVIEYMIRTGRFDFIKDTCCHSEMIRQRLEMLKGTGIRLFNANAATLSESLLYGAAGYSGVMLNFIPEIFAGVKALCRAGEDAQGLMKLITVCSVYEYQNYPRNAKFLLKQKGVLVCDAARCTKEPLSESQKGELLAFMYLLENNVKSAESSTVRYRVRNTAETEPHLSGEGRAWYLSEMVKDRIGEG